MWSRLKRVRLPAETSLGSCFDRVAHRLLGRLSYPSTGRQEQEGQGAGSSCFLSPSPLLVALLFPPSCPESPRQCLGTDWITTPSHRVVLWHGFASAALVHPPVSPSRGKPPHTTLLCSRNSLQGPGPDFLFSFFPREIPEKATRLSVGHCPSALISRTWLFIISPSAPPRQRLTFNSPSPLVPDGGLTR